MIETWKIWTVILGLGLGSFGLRFVFLGIVGSRPMPDWLLRHLRYTPAAVLPALVAPMVAWPAGTDGQVDPPRLAAAAVTIAVGIWTRNIILAILSGAGVLFAMLWLLG